MDRDHSIIYMCDIHTTDFFFTLGSLPPNVQNIFETFAPLRENLKDQQNIHFSDNRTHEESWKKILSYSVGL